MHSSEYGEQEAIYLGSSDQKHVVPFNVPEIMFMVEKESLFPSIFPKQVAFKD